MRRAPLIAATFAAALVLGACGGGLELPETTGAIETGAAAEVQPTLPETGATAPASEPFQLTLPGGQPIGPTSPANAIKRLQRALKMLGFNVGTPDGIWGAKTTKAVKQFQKRHKLGQDGVVGPKTLEALNAELRALEGASGS